MRLKKFIVQNYRSIVEATLDDIGTFTAIVGPNNAGKSNLLRALIVALTIALEGDFQRARRRNQFSFIYEGEDYNWERDIPKVLIANENNATVFKLTFEFSEDEKCEFRNELGINLSKSLQMKFQLSKKKTEYNIIMPGRAKAPMEERIREIGLFIRSKLDYQYIPCVRTSELTSEYYFKIINKELELLYRNPEYIEYINKIKELQRPLYDGLSSRLTDILKTFLPNINSVSIDYDQVSPITSSRTLRSRRIPSFFIDDGNKTELEEKGDGVKSLAAIGLVQSLSFDEASGKSIIMCIEEPEAHLHPEAIHSLKTIIMELANRIGVQVVISTHSPLLVDRNQIHNNVVVDSNYRVSTCRSLYDIRNVLGVRITDNMSGAQKVILVEGESDKRYFQKLCSDKYPALKIMIDSCELEFVNVHSASKMDYQIRLYNSMIIPTIILADNDDSGIQSMNSLMSNRIKNSSEIFLIKSIGMNKSELEDIVKFDSYMSTIRDSYNINLNTPEFTSRRLPWSDRLKSSANRSPAPYDDNIENQIKTKLADIVEENGINAIADYDKALVNIIIDAIAKYAGII